MKHNLVHFNPKIATDIGCICIQCIFNISLFCQNKPDNITPNSSESCEKYTKPKFEEK